MTAAKSVSAIVKRQYFKTTVVALLLPITLLTSCSKHHELPTQPSTTLPASPAVDISSKQPETSTVSPHPAVTKTTESAPTPVIKPDHKPLDLRLQAEDLDNSSTATLQQHYDDSQYLEQLFDKKSDKRLSISSRLVIEEEQQGARYNTDLQGLQQSLGDTIDSVEGGEISIEYQVD